MIYGTEKRHGRDIQKKQEKQENLKQKNDALSVEQINELMFIYNKNDSKVSVQAVN